MAEFPTELDPIALAAVTAEANARIAADNAEIAARSAAIAAEAAARIAADATKQDTITAGAGITKAGATLDVGEGQGIDVAADSVAVEWGTGTTQVRRGDDAAYTNSRTPTGHHATHEPGGSDALATFVGMQPPWLVAQQNPVSLTSASTTFSVNDLTLMRMVIRKTGTLRDLAIWVATASGNLRPVVYSGAATRALLWDGGSVASPAAGAWRILGDPNLAVAAGDELELGFIVDNATFSVGTSGTLDNGRLPANFGNATGARFNSKVLAGSFSAPATITEANMTAFGRVCAVVARIS